MVRIIWSRDESIIDNLEYDRFIKTIGEYPELYAKIVDSINNDKNLNLIILNSYVAGWLKILAQRYGSRHVQYSEVSARSILEKNTHLKVPDYVTDDEIIESELLELRIPAEERESFENYLLENFLANFLNKPKFVLLASKIQKEYNKLQWEEALDRPLVKKIYKNRLRNVRDELLKGNLSTKKSLLELLTWFEKSPDFFLEQIAYLKILQTYPDKIGKRLFGNLFIECFQLGLEAKGVKVPTILRDDIISELNIFFARKTQTEDELLDMIEKCSGLLLFELDNIFNHIKNAPFTITQSIIITIEKKFSAKKHDSNFSILLSDLRNYLTIPKPDTPESDWGELEMINWAIEQFLPYKFQLEEKDKIDNEARNLASIYSEWLFKNYPKMIYHSSSMAWKAFLNLRDEISEYPGTTLVIMVDNLNFKFYPILKSLLSNYQFHQQSLQHCLSLLPSSTEVSKKGIIAGSYKPFEGGNYRKTIEQIWASRLSKKAKYLANVSELRQIKHNKWDIYFLNYLPIDTLLHQSEKQTGISHKRLVSIYLGSLVKDIIGFLNRFNIRHKCKLIILSDHGSTKIPEDAENVLQDSFLRHHAIDEHHRFLSMSKEEFENNSIEQEDFRYYAFNAEKYHLQEHFLVAKKYYRFKSGHDLSYIHGGLSPEETIIPVAVFEAKQLVPKKLGFIILSPESITIGTRQLLLLEITNHNNFPLNNVLITFPDQNIEIEPIGLQVFPKLSRRNESVKYSCPVNADVTKNDLSVSIEYQVEEIPYQEFTNIPVKYRTLIETKFDFDNL